MSKKKEDAQAALDVAEEAGTRTINVNFRRKARELQDGHVSKKSFEELNEAYQVLIADRSQAKAALESKPNVTVLSSDVAEYSRMIAEDEEDTLKFFGLCAQAFHEIVRRFQGRVFNTAGDAILAEFADPRHAVDCAVEIQRELRAVNLGRPEGRRILFRIGLNLGDVYVNGTDLLGDTVNIAARMQTAAKPGGICLSQDVFTALGKSAHAFHDLGEKTFKNIPQPIRTYALTTEGAVAKPTGFSAPAMPAKIVRKAERSGIPAAAKAAIAVAACAVLGVAAWQFRPAKPVPKPAHKAEAPVETPAPAPVASVTTAPAVDVPVEHKAEAPAASAGPAVDPAVQKEAEGGDSNTNFQKGEQYLNGGKFAEAYEFFKMSALKGHPGSQFRLGTLYLSEKIGPKDTDAAIYWLLHAALDGQVMATQFLTQHAASDFREYSTYIYNQQKIDGNRRPAETANLKRQAEAFLTGIHDKLQERGLPVLTGSW